MANSVTTATAREAFAQAHGTTGILPKVIHIAFGDGGTDAGGVPITPETTETGLRNELLRKPLETVSYPVATTVRFIGRLTTGELIGSNISEVGLVDELGQVVAIKTFSAKGKDEETELIFEWDEEF